MGLVDWDLRPPCLQYSDATTGSDRYEELRLKLMRLTNSWSAENYGGRSLQVQVRSTVHQVSEIRNPEITKTLCGR
jgi:hypothetical protein